VIPKVYDATLFSIELDLLEIRLKELLDVVDVFLIVESNSTFTGLPKPKTFALNRSRFKFAEHKIMYKAIDMPPIKPGQNPFELEKLQRVAMNNFMFQSGIQTDDWVLMMDVDEIPSWHTVQLIRSCDNVPSPLHLQLRNYLYSFEFLLDMESWRGKAVRYPFGYGHQKNSEDMLADAGWHCSYCFRTLDDFEFKMKGFSHADRVHHESILDRDRIQKVICEGSDLYDMMPEAYNYKEMFQKWGSLPRQTSAISLPKNLLQNAKKYSFLLPGNCKREE
jgi:beta-1,4-mannosyl-glycoprotein beta-1,4-N-acetylglucosaminyltransferase